MAVPLTQFQAITFLTLPNRYDCSSADINPIGSIDKADLKRLIAWAKISFALPCLQEFIDAVPTAELEPITATYVQSDEADMGMVRSCSSSLLRFSTKTGIGQC